MRLLVACWLAALGLSTAGLLVDLHTNFENILFQRSGGVIAGIAALVVFIKFRRRRSARALGVADRVFKSMGQATPAERREHRFRRWQNVTIAVLGVLGTVIATFGDYAKGMLPPKTDQAEQPAQLPVTPARPALPRPKPHNPNQP